MLNLQYLQIHYHHSEAKNVSGSPSTSAPFKSNVNVLSSATTSSAKSSSVGASYHVGLFLHSLHVTLSDKSTFITAHYVTSASPK